jgi:hypothetical protein
MNKLYNDAYKHGWSAAVARMQNFVEGKADSQPVTGCPSLRRPVTGKRPAFTWAGIGIPIGAKLQFKLDESITCETIDDRLVLFDNEIYSINHLTAILSEALDYHCATYGRGKEFWRYRGKTLEHHIVASH